MQVGCYLFLIINLTTMNKFSIRVVDYMRNKAKCECGCVSFFSTSKNKYTHTLCCAQCDTVYTRNYKSFKFEILN